jgi:hypothetical protein
MRVFSLFFVLILSAATGAGAQGVTPWGDPDLQGTWTNQTPTPLERPDVLGSKRFFTAEEAAKFEATALSRLLETVAPEVPLSGELNEIWLETQHGRVPPTLATSLVVDPANGKVPYTAEGKKRWDAVPKIGMSASAGTDRPEDRTLAERCVTTDGLLVPNPFYNNYFQIIQAPGYVVIVTEMMHEARIIPLDGRAPLGGGVRTWTGDSRGRWEGKTLVVETANFNDRRLFRGATEQLRLVERFTRRDAETIDYRLTVTDPATFTQPWTIENALRTGDGELYEVGCHEGNIGLRGILAGARAQEHH